MLLCVCQWNCVFGNLFAAEFGLVSVSLLRMRCACGGASVWREIAAGADREGSVQRVQ